MFEALRLLQISDLHVTAAEDAAARGLRAVVAAIAAPGAPTPQAVLATGDLVDDGAPQSYAHLARLLAPLPAPLHALPGNHDEPAAVARWLGGAAGTLPLTVDLGGWRLLLLDDHLPGRPEGQLGPERLAALGRALDLARDRHVLIALHHPPLPIGSAWMDAMGLLDGPALMALLARYPAVRVLLFGHAHQVFDAAVGGLRVLGCPSTCVQFRPRSADHAIESWQPAWRWLDLAADGGVATGVCALPAPEAQTSS